MHADTLYILNSPLFFTGSLPFSPSCPSSLATQHLAVKIAALYLIGIHETQPPNSCTQASEFEYGKGAYRGNVYVSSSVQHLACTGPAPAAARYSAAGEPRPPHPTISTEDFASRPCPSTPICTQAHPCRQHCFKSKACALPQMYRNEYSTLQITRPTLFHSYIDSARLPPKEVIDTCYRQITSGTSI